MTLNRKTLALLAFAVVLVVSVAVAEDHNNLQSTTDEGISHARTYAYWVAIGDNDEVKHVGKGHPAEERVNARPLPAVALIEPPTRECIRTPKCVESRPYLSHFEPPAARMALMMLERRGIFYVLTFAARQDQYSDLYIAPDKKPLLVSVAVRYYEERPSRFFSRILLKLANSWFMPEAIRRNASGGQWLLVDFEYTYNLRDYYDWLVQNQERLEADRKQRAREFLENLDVTKFGNDIRTRALRSLSDKYDWTREAVKDQLLHVAEVLSAK